MNQPQPGCVSLADFLICEQHQAERNEWIDGAVVLYAAVSYEHSTISSNLTATFHAAVGDGAVHGSHV